MCRRRAESRELEEDEDEEEEESIQDIPSFIPYNLLTQARQTHTHTLTPSGNFNYKMHRMSDFNNRIPETTAG